jgi:hypothetical protein
MEKNARDLLEIMWSNSAARIREGHCEVYKNGEQHWVAPGYPTVTVAAFRAYLSHHKMSGLITDLLSNCSASLRR